MVGMKTSIHRGAPGPSWKTTTLYSYYQSGIGTNIAPAIMTDLEPVN